MECDSPGRIVKRAPDGRRVPALTRTPLLPNICFTPRRPQPISHGRTVVQAGCPGDMKQSSMTIALATPRVATSMEEGLERISRFMAEAAQQQADIICFPEAYLPGLRGQDFELFNFDEAMHANALQIVAQAAREHRLTTILGMERPTKMGRQIVAYVFDERGNRQGMQTKNQLDPGEDRYYVPGNMRRMFFAGDVKFGIAI